ncbi:hypothetical protein AAL_02739 [Moelleriella libera RCEF 2490]|uniref:DUF7924 domain-containing protein n=1 Tax=Moelleriella libera RCEF 2490 TaxID=1081109 RepID=A0A168EVG8_9HYPO|nr:hypothetical protein AAL_02739 [Moelleriella libera RCEF 2490]
MTSNSISASSRSQRARSDKSSTETSRSTRSSAYDENFEHHLRLNGIFPEGYEYPDDRSTPEPTNLDSIHQALLCARASLSPTCFSESAFRDFKRKNKTKSEGTVIRSVVPIIAGNAHIPNEGHLPFTNLDSLTKEATVRAVPDYFDGAHPEALDRQVSQDLSQMIIPTKHSGVPTAPNFFLEVKASKGSADVDLRQACLDGAYGARAMNALRSYKGPELAHDRSAYTYSSTYHDGTLKLYAHHVEAPHKSGGRPAYHMTKLRGFDMTDNRDTFVAGASAFRNVRDLAKQHRDVLIQAANARTVSKAAVASGEALSEACGEPTERVDSIRSSQSTKWQDACDELGIQTAGDDHSPSFQDNAPGNVPGDVSTDYDSHDPSQRSLEPDGPPISSVPGVKPSCSDIKGCLKRLGPALGVDSSRRDRCPSKGRIR